MSDNICKVDLFNDLYKNTHTALQSISNVMPKLSDLNNKIKAELQEQYDGYERFLSDLSAYMKNNDMERKDINAFKKMMLWGAVQMNTMADTTDNHIADIMLKGTLMGITDVTTMLNGTDGKLPEDVKEYAQRLLKLQEDYEKRLKKFL